MIRTGRRDKLELREAGESKGPGTVFGYAMKWDEWSEVIWDFRERFRPFAFRKSLEGGIDTRFLAAHSSALLLGRRSVGTAKFEEDGVGLRFEVDLPDNTVGNDMAVSVQRGDLDGVSIGFRPVSQTWTNREKDDEFDVDWTRDVVEAELDEVSLVTWPAYKQTVAQIREVERDLVMEARSKLGNPDVNAAEERDRQARSARTQSAINRYRLLRATL